MCSFYELNKGTKTPIIVIEWTPQQMNYSLSILGRKICQFVEIQTTNIYRFMKRFVIDIRVGEFIRVRSNGAEVL